MQRLNWLVKDTICSKTSYATITTTSATTASSSRIAIIRMIVVTDFEICILLSIVLSKLK